MQEKKLSLKNETILNIDGRNVKFIEYESDHEGVFIKVCTNQHNLGVNAEYAWVESNYNNYELVQQALTKIKLNDNIVKCDILTIKTDEGNTINIYFDISQMMENLDNKTKNITNKDLWEDKAKTIYNKLIQEHNFSILDNDEESLHKKINDSVSIVFDITYFLGFVINENISKSDLFDEKEKCHSVLKKYFKNKFIGNKLFSDRVIGGYIRIDELNDINIVFENYKNIQKEYEEAL